MTLAGIASLFVAQDYLDAEDFGEQVGRPPFTPALEKALKWLEADDNSVIALPQAADFTPITRCMAWSEPGWHRDSNITASHDWYRDRAADIVAAQNGRWITGATPVNRSTRSSIPRSRLLFLARGRHPVLMNKLRFDGDWANRPRDVANLARFASAELERPLNWQVVPLDRDWVDWTDSPILYMASDKPPKLTDDDRQKIKQLHRKRRDAADAGGWRRERTFRNSSKTSAISFSRNITGSTCRPISVLYSVSYHITDRPKIRVDHQRLANSDDALADGCDAILATSRRTASAAPRLSLA